MKLYLNVMDLVWLVIGAVVLILYGLFILFIKYCNNHPKKKKEDNKNE